eukprot:353632-Chlamydomonas_euryale.AAC.12
MHARTCGGVMRGCDACAHMWCDAWMRCMHACLPVPATYSPVISGWYAGHHVACGMGHRHGHWEGGAWPAAYGTQPEADVRAPWVMRCTAHSLKHVHRGSCGTAPRGSVMRPCGTAPWGS